MDFTHESAVFLDPAIRDWVLFPIMLIMILVGLLRHHVTALLLSPASAPKVPLSSIREAQALMRVRALARPLPVPETLTQKDSSAPTAPSTILPRLAFAARKAYILDAITNNSFLKNPDAPAGPANPMTDPQGMESMMDGMKKNMVMMVPQMLIMSWISYFFTGFVLIRLPFPLTLRFKAMLQRGIETYDMDVSWVSSLSWYFLNLFGLRGVFQLLLGEENAADSIKEMQAMTPQGQMNAMGGGQIDYRALFKAEKENLDLVSTPVWALEGIELRLIDVLSHNVAPSTKKTL